jgi:tellurite methyltransferase
MKSKCEWNQFYANNQSNYDFEPSVFLQKMYIYLNKGITLDLACGTGRNAIFLAKNNFKVKGIDFSENAINIAKDLSKDLDIEYQLQDLDFYLSSIMSLDSAVAIDYKCSQRLLEDIKKGLKIGGTLYVENYTYEHLKKFNPDNLTVDNCYKAFELAKLLKNWNILYYDEIQSEKVCKVKALVKKPSF